MQHLHLVGFTAELDGLIFSARRGSKSGGYVVSLDDRLLDSIREAVRLQTGAELDIEPEEGAPAPVAIAVVPELRRLGRVHSALSPKDIQARLRAGRSVSEVADEAEVDESWILRFASPVLAEQSRIVERALRLPCRANRKGESAEPLDVSVNENLIERGTLLTPDEISSAWSAYHVRDSAWVVRFRYVSRRRQQVAQWAFDLADSTLVPINRLATELGYLEPGRRKRRVASPEIVDDRRQPGGEDGAATSVPTAARTAAKRRPAGAKARVGKTTATSRPAKAAAGRRPVTRTGAARATGASKRVAAGASKRAAKRTTTATRPAAKVTKATKATKAAATRRAATKSAKAPAARRAAASRAPARKATARVAGAATKRAGAATTKTAATKTAAKRPATATKRAGAATTKAAAKRPATATKRAAAVTKRVGATTQRAGTARRVATPAARKLSSRAAAAAKAPAAKRAPAAKARASTTKPVAAKRAPARRATATTAKRAPAGKAAAATAKRAPARGAAATTAKRAPARKAAATTAAVTEPRTPPPTSLLVTDRPPEPEVIAVPKGPIPGAVPNGPVPNGASPETVGSAPLDDVAPANGPSAVPSFPPAPGPASSTTVAEPVAPPAELPTPLAEPVGGPVTAPLSGIDGAVRARRSSVADIGGDPSAAEARRQRPLVAVRAAQPAVPLSERVVRLPSGENPGPDGNRESTGSVVIQAVPAGEGMAPPTLEP